jgi:hypothetical protein
MKTAISILISIVAIIMIGCAQNDRTTICGTTAPADLSTLEPALAGLANDAKDYNDFAGMLARQTCILDVNKNQIILESFPPQTSLIVTFATDAGDKNASIRVELLDDGIRYMAMNVVE